HPLTFYKAPLYPYVVAGMYEAFGDPALPLALLQILASCGSVLILFDVTRRLFGSQAGFLAAALLVAYGPAVHYDVVMLRGPLQLLLALLGTWLLLRFRSSGSPREALGLGAVVGLGLLLNEGFLPVPFLAGLLLAAWTRGSLRSLTRALCAFTLGMLLVLAPVFARNVAVGAPALKLAVTGGTVYAVFNAHGTSPYRFEARPAAFVPVMAESGGGLLRTAWACLRSFPGPGSVALFYLRKASLLLVPYENPDNANFYYAALEDPLLAALPAHGLLAPLAALGVVAAARRRAPGLDALLPYGLSLLVAMIAALPLSRYRVVFAAFLMPFAGLAVEAGAGLLRRRAFWKLAAAAGAALALAVGFRAWERTAVFAGAPPGRFLYRAPEFLLSADAYAREGRCISALGQVDELLAMNPDPEVRPAALGLAERIRAFCRPRKGPG
ncbi:MAG TPA: glycosyltransferase family 39 protein, partial [Vicinamibacteria bacterium]